MRPTRVERYFDMRQAEQRLRQLGARFDAAHSDASRAIYYLGRDRSYVEAVRRNGAFELAYFATCPCG